MTEWLSSPGVEPIAVLVRLVAALAMGGVVAWIHSRTSQDAEMGASTLVLLAVLIAMVTQVIGDNVARAFSLVGALSIVRFRTVVRDTRDTAFVIFGVVVGMAAGAQNIWVGLLGLTVGGAAAFALSALISKPASAAAPVQWIPEQTVTIRAAKAVGLEKAVGDILAVCSTRFRLASIGTIKMGTAFEGQFQIELAPGFAAEDLLRQLARIEGVSDVKLQWREGEEE